jgi:hypothetical protein
MDPDDKGTGNVRLQGRQITYTVYLESTKLRGDWVIAYKV